MVFFLKTCTNDFLRSITDYDDDAHKKLYILITVYYIHTHTRKIIKLIEWFIYMHLCKK